MKDAAKHMKKAKLIIGFVLGHLSSIKNLSNVSWGVRVHDPTPVTTQIKTIVM